MGTNPVTRSPLTFLLFLLLFFKFFLFSKPYNNPTMRPLSHGPLLKHRPYFKSKLPVAPGGEAQWEGDLTERWHFAFVLLQPWASLCAVHRVGILGLTASLLEGGRGNDGRNAWSGALCLQKGWKEHQPCFSSPIPSSACCCCSPMHVEQLSAPTQTPLFTPSPTPEPQKHLGLRFAASVSPPAALQALGDRGAPGCTQQLSTASHWLHAGSVLLPAAPVSSPSLGVFL